jgi:RNA polymerase sigma-70 factor (ECF subfamily)
LEEAENWDWNRLRTQCEREARRLLVDAHDAEDAVQEAMARAWRRRHRCRSPEAPLPWFMQITRNEAFRLMATRRRAPAAAGEVAEGTLDDGGGCDVDRVALKVDVGRALAQLPSRDRTLARLRYGEDLAQKRIADVLETPAGTIRVQLHRLRERLKRDLSETFESSY